MIQKTPIRPERVRTVPSSFSWVDHRLVRHRRLQGCAHSSWALYLFLVSVGDVQGLSYYSDASLCRHLAMDPLQLAASRQQLLEVDLIAYRKPLYQVLALLDPTHPPAEPEAPRQGQTRSVAEILRQILHPGSP